MDSNKYLAWAMTKDRTDQGYLEHGNKNFTGNSYRMINAALGISGEAGEVVDIIKKHTQFNKELDKAHLKEELGDLLWYVALMLKTIDSDFEEIMLLNIDKLNIRFPSAFSEEKALKREDEGA